MSRHQNSLRVWRYLVYPSIAASVLSLWKCQEVEGVGSIFVVDPETLCTDESHRVWLNGVGVPSILLYVLGLPALALGVLFELFLGFRRRHAHTHYTSQCPHAPRLCATPAPLLRSASAALAQTSTGSIVATPKSSTVPTNSSVRTACGASTIPSRIVGGSGTWRIRAGATTKSTLLQTSTASSAREVG